MNEIVINGDSVVKAREDVFSTSVGDELVIFDAESGTYFGSGDVGQQIWQELSEKTTANAVCDALMEKFDVDRATCEEQVFAFIAELSKRGLLEVK